MEAFIPFAFFGVVIAIVVGAIVLHYKMEKKRTETITEIATELGLNFVPKGDGGLRERLGQFEMFRRGHGRKWRNALIGETDEVRLALFDYQYTTGSGKNSHTYRQTVAAIESDSLGIPPFTMRPEGLFDAVGGMLGFQDIDFDDHPEFSRLFVLKSSQEEIVRQYFDRPILDYFASKKGITVAAVPGQMIFYRASKRVKPEELKQLLSDAYEIYGLLVDRQSRGGPSAAAGGGGTPIDFG